MTESYIEWLVYHKLGMVPIEEEVDIIEEEDYNDDVDFLRTYGRA